MDTAPRNIWVTSDTHYNHKNMLTFLDKDGATIRPFSSVEEMNETMIDRWNAVVQGGDIVYHLGDVYLGDGAAANTILSRLKGRKRLVLGNHDNGRDQILLKHFQKIVMWRKWPDFGIILSHTPLHEASLRGLGNVHGHIHQNDSPPGPYRNVCVEKTGYAPVHLEELRMPDRVKNPFTRNADVAQLAEQLSCK